MNRPDHEVVVVGAGLLGCSAAYHLLRRGVGRVVVVDAVGPGRATSGAGAGFVGTWAAGYIPQLWEHEVTLEAYGLDFYRELGEHRDIALRANGSLFVSRTEAGHRSVQAIIDHPLAPAGTRELSPVEVGALSGGALEPAQVFGAALHPAGIQIDTTPATEALAARIEEMGAELRIGEAVTGLLHDDADVAGVSLASGALTAGHTLLATGAWTNRLLAGTAPALPIAHQTASRVICAPSGVQPTLPTVMVPELRGLWLREQAGGLTYGNLTGYAYTDTVPVPERIGGRPRCDRLVEVMVDELAPQLHDLLPRTDVTVAEWRQGVVGHTPDGLFIAGSLPGMGRLSVLAGCNEGGVTHGPGLGRMIADIIAVGGTDFVDAGRYRPDRFDPLDFPDEASVLRAYARAHEPDPPEWW